MKYDLRSERLINSVLRHCLPLRVGSFANCHPPPPMTGARPLLLREEEHRRLVANIYIYLP